MKLENLDRSRWTEIQAVLDVALGLESTERDAYVDRACAGNDTLRRDVLALLAADGDAGGFLSVPVSAIGLDEDGTTPTLPTAGEDTAAPVTPPERIGRYVVEAEIGRGGMGVVYRGMDPIRRRSVAIKALNAGQAQEPEYLASVLREAKLLAWLQHPNVATIYGVEREAGVPYLVMERVEGQSLAQQLARGPLSTPETLDIARQIADALGAAHAAGIVHRDIKPQNVMITPGGLAKVLDFGVARHVVQAPLVRTNADVDAMRMSLTSRWGTPGYMSPEQILGLENDARVDAFAFGCIVYECLTHVCPFARDSVLATVSATLRGEVDWDRLPPDTPEALRSVIASLLRSNPGERQGDMARVAHELAECLGTFDARTSPGRMVATSSARLPATPFDLIGRTRELEAAERLLAHSRIVTLTGPPGVGKTRLAIEVARRWDARHPRDLWFVDLASVSDDYDVAVAFRGALGSDSGEDPARGIAARLGAREGLLVLDGGGTTALPVPDLVRSVLDACPGLRVLATSGQRLGFDGEQTLGVPPLDVPHDEAHRSLESIAGCDAVALLVAAGRRARPSFTIDPEHAHAAARIARAVDGVPLALELAGAMLRDDTLQVVAARTERAASERGDRLETLLSLSHATLLDDERALFADLSVFAGGWTLESALAVCDADGDPFSLLDRITRLVEKSFVVIERGDRVEPRYRYLEPIRRFAVSVCATSASSERRARHADYFSALSERLSADLSKGRTDPRSLAIYQAEHPNMLEAIRTCEQMNDPMRALALAGGLWRFWSIRGIYVPGRQILQHVLDLPGAAAPTPARAEALFGEGVLALYQADLDDAEARAREALATYRAVGDRSGYGRALVLLGSSANNQGRPLEACDRYREAAALFRQLSDAWGLTMALNNLGVVQREQEDYRAALATYEENLEHAKHWGESEWLSVTYVNLSLTTLRLGLHERARLDLIEAIELLRELGWKRMIVSAFEVGGELLLRLGEPGPAVESYGSADALRRSIATPVGIWWGMWRDRILRELTEQLGEAGFQARWSAGTARTMDQALVELGMVLKSASSDRPEPGGNAHAIR